MIDSTYLEARTALNTALCELHEQGIEVDTSAFKAVFKQQTLSLYERLLDDPETYKV